MVVNSGCDSGITAIRVQQPWFASGTAVGDDLPATQEPPVHVGVDALEFLEELGLDCLDALPHASPCPTGTGLEQDVSRRGSWLGDVRTHGFKSPAGYDSIV